MDDSDGVPWSRFNPSRGELCVPYGVPSDIHLEIRSCIREYMPTNQHLFFTVTLPYFSVPMWVTNESEINSWLNYSFCCCFECGLILRSPGRLILVFLLGKDDNDPALCMSWRIALVGPCCLPDLIYGASYYPFMLYVHSQIRESIEAAWNQFNDVPLHNHCIICDIEIENGNEDLDTCLNDICVYLRCCTKSIHELTLEERRDNLLWFFYCTSVDVVTPLLQQICHHPSCEKPLREQSRYPRDQCGQCKRVCYCSSRCRKRHRKKHRKSGCISYREIWDSH